MPTALADGTREYTAEGILRAGAVLTRAGSIHYTRKELGLDGDPTAIVQVERTMESLSHPDTLASLRGAPITVLHPEDGVTPDNWKSEVVGAVAGEPRVVGDTIIADVVIGDENALKRLNDGVEELSIGYKHQLGVIPGTDMLRTVGPLTSNHVALVPRGRAGPDVRVLDTAPAVDKSVDNDRAASQDKGDPRMDEQAVKDAVAAAVSDAMKQMDKSHGMDAAALDAFGKKMGDAISDAMSGMMKKMGDATAKLDKVAADAAAKDAAADAAAAKQRATDAAAKLVADTQATERERMRLVFDALPLLGDNADLATLADADAKTILATALDGLVEDPEKHSVDYLRGALDVAKARGSQSVADTGTGLPPGVAAFPKSISSTDGQSQKDAALKEYVDSHAEAYQKAGGI